ncbi:hypothetical protein F442_02554 [Phytophthora nicotianae P10297]|uniref:Ubiquitin-like protease family profile domain-containing protein n=1 Tax=Phytophthora nicotianae P10297 TaxID=1317064 RepID=W2ZZI8_PHYNI|nr:hypothetical protein F442_02554 [Phytophthora nicotianae P10297]
MLLRTLLLPCRHVIYLHKHQSWESAIPPPKFYTARWSLLSPTNDISTGYLDGNRSLRMVKRATNDPVAQSRDRRCSETRAVCQQLQGIMADQNTEDFRSTFKLLQTVEKLCRAGDVRKLVDALEVIKSQDYEMKRQRPEDSGVDRAKQIGFENLKFSKSVRQTQASRPISGIEMRAEGEEGNAVYLARWYDIGYATVGQLKIMVLVTDAKVAMTKVEATLAWIDSVIVNPSGVGSPFNDSPLFPKEMFKDNVENMALNSYTSAGEDIEGRLLQFRGNEWLNSTCITMNVGFIVPDWYGYQDVTARKKAAATNGAFHSSNQRQIGIVNSCGNHWIAFYLDRTSSPVTCTLFDPQQSKLRYNEIEGAVLSDIVPQLAGKPVVKFERWEKCKQEDGHSCGVWSLFFL